VQEGIHRADESIDGIHSCLKTGMVAVVQTFGSTINFHPHIHAIVSRGGWTKGDDWCPIP
jgi:hypothetical protein